MTEVKNSLEAAKYRRQKNEYVREVFGYYLLEYFFCPPLSLFSFWHPCNTDVAHLTLSQTCLRLSSFVFNLFSLFCSASIISTNLSSTLLICSSAFCILLLAASSEFFYFSYCILQLFLFKFYILYLFGQCFL